MESPIKAMGIAAGVFTLMIVGLTIAFGSWYTVDQGERAVLTRWGAVVDDKIGPGLHWKTPWIEDATKLEVSTQKSVYDNMEAYSRDQQPAHFKISVNWHVPADRVGEVYWRYGGDLDGLVDRLLDRHVPQQSKNVFGRYNAITLIQDRNTFNQDVLKALLASVEGQPIVVESVQVEDVQFSQDYIAAVKARMIAEVEVQKLKQQEEQQKVQAEITVINANAEAQARVARAEAEAKAVQLNGEAHAAAIKAQAEALSQNPGLVLLRQAEKWDGKLPVQMIPNSALPFLSLQAPSVPANVVRTTPVEAPR